MAYDEGLAQLLRDDLAGEPITEKRMFGGLAFLLAGNMVCGVHKGGTMYRLGKSTYAGALTLAGAIPMQMGDRVMANMVAVSEQDSANDGLRSQLLQLALATVRALPPKVAKPKKG